RRVADSGLRDRRLDRRHDRRDPEADRDVGRRDADRAAGRSAAFARGPRGAGRDADDDPRAHRGARGSGHERRGEVRGRHHARLRGGLERRCAALPRERLRGTMVGEPTERRRRMKAGGRPIFGRVSACVAAAAVAAGCAKSPESRVAAEWDLLERYCEDCHNNAEFAGDLSLERFSTEDIGAHPAVWEEVVRKLRGDLMPPPGVPRPDAERIDALVAALEARLDELAAERGPMPGHVVMHRLNRAEYAREIEDLLGLRIDAQAMLPADVESHGFDNIASALRVSPTHLDQYLAAAR